MYRYRMAMSPPPQATRGNIHKMLLYPSLLDYIITTKIAHNYIRIKGASGNRHAPHIATPQLLNSDSLHLWQLLTTLTLWESDFKHTVAHLCRNLILVNTLWEVENLAE